jgi:type 1 glutamine amidotransferase
MDSAQGRSRRQDSLALIVWGGWEGHQPAEVAKLVGRHLHAAGYQVESVEGVEAMSKLELAQFDLLVPVWSFGIQQPAALQSVLAAVDQGVGIATFHGGIDWFAHRDYARMIGGHFVHHPPICRYQVTIEDRMHPATRGLEDFAVETEQYYFHLDPGNHVLTSTRFGDLRMPNTWTRTYGRGRVYYCSLAHTLDDLQQPPVLSLLLQGMQWATRRQS